MSQRLFIAFELPPAVLESLEKTQAQLKTEPGAEAVRWVDIRSIHLTLKFLGDTEERLIPKIKAVLDRICAANRSMDFKLAAVGAFPNLRRVRVIWVGVDNSSDIDQLKSLVGAIDAEMQQLGFPAEERPFSPHLTLGRVRQDASYASIQMVSTMLAQAPSVLEVAFKLDSISLMRSDLRPTGAVYNQLHRTLLSG